ncbi:hypothetical protein JHK86_001097 [Glycine max]|nr:hypothetical protein JHK86_001097 [Glycine max]
MIFKTVNVKYWETFCFELLSKALGLKPDHLKEMDCAKGHLFFYHCYPLCPEAELTIGTRSHTDPDFLSILLQDHVGGLEVLVHNHWIDMPPISGALVVNIGGLPQDLMVHDSYLL